MQRDRVSLKGVPGTIGLGLIEVETCSLADGMEGAISQTEKFLSIPKARLQKKRNETMPRFIGDIQNKMINGDVLAWNINAGDCLNTDVPSVAVLIRFKDATRIDECVYASINSESRDAMCVVFKCAVCAVMHHVKPAKGGNRPVNCEQCKQK